MIQSIAVSHGHDFGAFGTTFQGETADVDKSARGNDEDAASNFIDAAKK